ncbi:ABC transporter permease [Limnochorda pilosa]|uniref:ABC transporter permease n=1 Tax=Limnochorda pilosa TaxID=1555112 RepID=A0A0K2SJ98_LIMPI|nr:ABC transporter permease [Limnochorda pilosa]BAS27168.1 ABC transporter permease [Limnochorda pilosa]
MSRNPKPDAGSQGSPQDPAPGRARSVAGALAEAAFSRSLVPLLAVFTGLVISAVLIVATDPAVWQAWGQVTVRPGLFLAAVGRSVYVAFAALFEGAAGSPYALSESLVTSTPYVFAGLAVAVGFRAGLFNIGAEGQLYIGALASVFVGYAVHGLPWFLHLPMAILAGAAAGAIWAAVPGYLRARTGAHEVVNTIMLNYVAFRLSDWLLNGPMKRPGPGGVPGWVPISPEVLPSAYLPRLFAEPLRLHWGFILAILVAVAAYYLLFRTTFGFEMRSVGANPSAARVAGMRVPRVYVLTMALSGALAAMAGVSQVLGVDRWLGQGFSAGYGFDSIALALLGKSHPAGVVGAALLFGFLRSGATRMQSVADIPIDIITIVQALVIVFVAAEALVRGIYRMKPTGEKAEEVFTRGWRGT